MTEAIEKVALADAAERLKGKIRDAFIELLTPEQFKDMVHAELKRFTESRKQPRYNGSNEYISVPSEFEVLCKEVFAEHVKAELKTLLASQEYQEHWGANGKARLSEAVKGWLTANSEQLIQATVLTLAGDMAQSMIQNLRNRL